MSFYTCCCSSSSSSSSLSLSLSLSSREGERVRHRIGVGDRRTKTVQLRSFLLKATATSMVFVVLLVTGSRICQHQQRNLNLNFNPKKILRHLNRFNNHHQPSPIFVYGFSPRRHTISNRSRRTVHTFPSIITTPPTGKATATTRTMILRLRSNLGTWRLETDDVLVSSSSNTEEDQKQTTAKDSKKTLYDLIQLQVRKNQQSLGVGGSGAVQPEGMIELDLEHGVSFDPQGKQQINFREPLNEMLLKKDNDLKHGTMLYARFNTHTKNDDRETLPSTSRSSLATDTAASASALASNTTTSMGQLESEKELDYNDNDQPQKNKNERQAKQVVIDLCDDDSDEDSDEVVVLDSSSMRAEGLTSMSTSSKKRKAATVSVPGSSSRSGNGSSSISKKSRPGSEQDNTRETNKFLCASYNVWFGPQNEATEVFPKERMAAIAQHLQEAALTSSSSSPSPLQFIGFQELTPSLVGYLKPHMNQMGYKFCTQPLGMASGGSPYGVGIAIPSDMPVVETEFVPYRNSVQGRGMLYVQTETVLFVTTHLESWCGPELTGAREREEQLVAAAAFCQGRIQQRPGSFGASPPSIAIITGDFNWDDERKRTSKTASEPPNRKLLDLLDDGWKDSAEPFDYTYDSKENPMLSGNLRRRFDRCIYFCSQETKKFNTAEFRKIGKEPIVPTRIWNKRNSFNGTTRQVQVCASDHFGIVIGFER